MTIDEAIAHCERIAATCGTVQCTEDHIQLAEWLKELKELKDCKPRWIPCSERLPEKPGKYLVTVQNGNVYTGTFDAYSGRFQCAATAWMPLPEPYKEQTNA